MATEPFVTALSPSPAQGSYATRVAVLRDYWALTKPEVNFLILITTFAGFYRGCASAGRPFSFAALFNTLLGTLLVASGTGTLNQYLERHFDAQMRRTARRPAAAGRIGSSAVLAFGIALSAVGTVYLASTVNSTASLLALFTLLSYLFLYTPLKRKTSLCVLIGAFPGAMPPLIGWAAAVGRLNIDGLNIGRLDMEPWMLYAILFLWQFPHFMAIAWMYREDYDRAGYLVLPKGRERLPFVIVQTILPQFALIALSIASLQAHHTDILLWWGALLGIGFLYFGLQFAVQRSRGSARQLLKASIIYLPLLCAFTLAI